MVRVDGTRDRPPGKTAQNWSRKDDIRAGAVSGPWRSAPRAAATSPGAATPAARETPVHSLDRAPAPAATTAGAAPAPDRVPAFRKVQAGQLRRMAIWIGLGALAAVAIVVAAVMLRPGEATAPPTAPEAATESGGVTAPPSAEGSTADATSAAAPAPHAVADPALAPVRTVRLRIGPDVDDARRDDLVAALKAAGVPEVVVEPLPFRIATSRIGYYRDADLAAAEALARVISPAIGEGATIGVRDYGELLSDPQPGRLDLWIGG